MAIYILIVMIGLARLPGQSFETMGACWAEAQWWIVQGHNAACQSTEIVEKRR